MAADGPDRYDGGPSAAELLAERFGPDAAEEVRRERFSPVRKTRRKTHMFVDDPEARDPHSRQQYCMCGLPADNAAHTLPRRHDDEREHEARRMGESA